ncbi:hypothetical protein [Terrisporobacter sp.]|uniref:hypothetical protein n=1 Tax=Terrisporobacter sp. TaxID=1965305 RepID=UPI002899EB8B|nr:hypothetical protein [Terrisporobacter sp.]
MTEEMTDIEKMEDLFKKYRMLKNEIEGINISIKHIGQRGMEYSGMPQATGISDKVQKNYNELEKLKREKFDKEIEIEQVDNMLKLLTEEEYKIIKLRYFDQLEIVKVASKTNMHINTYYNKRAKIFDEIIPYAKYFKLIK